MERYKVTVHPPGGGPISTVVPFRSESSVEAFSQEVLRRASKRIPQLPANATNTSLHLGGADGPFLDLEDHLQDVVIAPETEHLFLLFPAEPPESESLATVSRCIRISGQSVPCLIISGSSEYLVLGSDLTRLQDQSGDTPFGSSA